MAKGYWIVHVDVQDEENYPQYLQAGAPVYEKFGARFVIRGGRHQSMEGASRSRHVVVEFEDYDTALAAYRSDEYQAARELRQRFADSDFLIIEGFE